MNAENSIVVELSHLRFFAFHGLYEEEKKTGNEFEVNVKVSFKTPETIINKLHDTINYVRLHAIVNEMMQHPEKLLETVAMKIVERIHEEFLFATHAEIQIVKLHPPIINFRGNVAVSYKKDFQ
ncbi:MAG: dihydroneopterin aldolase [Bacteroidota bacterium]